MTLVEKLVRCWSPSGSESDIAELLLAEMKARGFSADLDGVGNAIGVIGSGERKLYLIGHMDTVLGEIPVKIEEGKLFGRGSVDAKGSLACFVESASQFATSENLEIHVIGCVDEESESTGAKHLLEAITSPNAVIIGEPSGWDAITLGYKGSLSLTYQFQVTGAHTGAYQNTPAEKAFEFYGSLIDSSSNIGTGFEGISINLKEINTSSDAIVDGVVMNLNVRTPVGFDLQQFQDVVSSLKQNATCEISEHTPAVKAPKNNNLVRAFLGSMRSHNIRPKFKNKTGTSDMNLLQAWDCPILAYGPGDSKLDHTPHEHLDLGEYQRAIEVLTGVIERFAQS